MKTLIAMFVAFVTLSATAFAGEVTLPDYVPEFKVKEVVVSDKVACDIDTGFGWSILKGGDYAFQTRTDGKINLVYMPTRADNGLTYDEITLAVFDAAQKAENIKAAQWIEGNVVAATFYQGVNPETGEMVLFGYQFQYKDGSCRDINYK